MFRYVVPAKVWTCEGGCRKEELLRIIGPRCIRDCSQGCRVHTTWKRFFFLVAGKGRATDECCLRSRRFFLLECVRGTWKQLWTVLPSIFKATQVLS